MTGSASRPFTIPASGPGSHRFSPQDQALFVEVGTLTSRSRTSSHRRARSPAFGCRRQSWATPLFQQAWRRRDIVSTPDKMFTAFGRELGTASDNEAWCRSSARSTGRCICASPRCILAERGLGPSRSDEGAEERALSSRDGWRATDGRQVFHPASNSPDQAIGTRLLGRGDCFQSSSTAQREAVGRCHNSSSSEWDFWGGYESSASNPAGRIAPRSMESQATFRIHVVLRNRRLRGTCKLGLIATRR